jgi:hypothetical protein
MAFRWAGRLQSIHHVDSYEIITSWRQHFPDTTEAEIDPHFLYHLGPPIVPQHEVKTGNIYRSGRVWAAIDLLLTCETISEARRKSEERAREAAEKG